SGSSAPFDTGTPATWHRSSNPRLFAQTWCTGTFPAVDAMPTRSASSLANRHSRANASSTPVSTSAKTGNGAGWSAAPATLSPYGRAPTNARPAPAAPRASPSAARAATGPHGPVGRGVAALTAAAAPSPPAGGLVRRANPGSPDTVGAGSAATASG